MPGLQRQGDRLPPTPPSQAAEEGLLPPTPGEGHIEWEFEIGEAQDLQSLQCCMGRRKDFQRRINNQIWDR